MCCNNQLSMITAGAEQHSSDRDRPWELLDIGLEVLPDGSAASW